MKVTGSHCPKWWLILDASALQEDTERLPIYIYTYYIYIFIYWLYSWVVHKPFTANILAYWNMMKICRNGHYTPQFLTCKPALYLSQYLYSMKQIKRESKREQPQRPPLSHREQINNSHPCWTFHSFKMSKGEEKGTPVTYILQGTQNNEKYMSATGLCHLTWGYETKTTGTAQLLAVNTTPSMTSLQEGDLFIRLAVWFPEWIQDSVGRIHFRALSTHNYSYWVNDQALPRGAKG
jgi:hypothetical protein